MLGQRVHWYQQVPDYQLMQRELDPEKNMYILSVGLHETTNIFIWRQSINRSLLKCVARFCFHLVLSFAPISLPLPSLHFAKFVLFSLYDMFVWFWFIVQTLRICCDAWQCIFLITYPSWDQGYHSVFCGLLCYDRCWPKYRPFLY